ncbi:hypothetical protein DFJ77DRAFT_455351 [Powellomyces hirtus]|nr:hypothetical protein DFJ77DRAFT_455351 [Powellomyces hirtus]
MSTEQQQLAMTGTPPTHNVPGGSPQRKAVESIVQRIDGLPANREILESPSRPPATNPPTVQLSSGKSVAAIAEELNKLGRTLDITSPKEVGKSTSPHTSIQSQSPARSPAEGIRPSSRQLSPQPSQVDLRGNTLFHQGATEPVGDWQSTGSTTLEKKPSRLAQIQSAKVVKGIKVSSVKAVRVRPLSKDGRALQPQQVQSQDSTALKADRPLSKDESALQPQTSRSQEISTDKTGRPLSKDASALFSQPPQLQETLAAAAAARPLSEDFSAIQPQHAQPSHSRNPSEAAVDKPLPPTPKASTIPPPLTNPIDVNPSDQSAIPDDVPTLPPQDDSSTSTEPFSSLRRTAMKHFRYPFSNTSGSDSSSDSLVPNNSEPLQFTIHSPSSTIEVMRRTTYVVEANDLPASRRGSILTALNTLADAQQGPVVSRRASILGALGSEGRRGSSLNPSPSAPASRRNSLYHTGSGDNSREHSRRGSRNLADNSKSNSPTLSPIHSNIIQVLPIGRKSSTVRVPSPLDQSSTRSEQPSEKPTEDLREKLSPQPPEKPSEKASEKTSPTGAPIIPDFRFSNVPLRAKINLPETPNNGSRRSSIANHQQQPVTETENADTIPQPSKTPPLFTLNPSAIDALPATATGSPPEPQPPTPLPKSPPTATPPNVTTTLKPTTNSPAASTSRSTTALSASHVSLLQAGERLLINARTAMGSESVLNDPEHSEGRTMGRSVSMSTLASIMNGSDEDISGLGIPVKVNKIDCVMLFRRNKLVCVDARGRMYGKYFALDMSRILVAGNIGPTITLFAIPPKVLTAGTKFRSFVFECGSESVAEAWCARLNFLACEGNFSQLVDKQAVLILDESDEKSLLDLVRKYITPVLACVGKGLTLQVTRRPVEAAQLPDFITTNFAAYLSCKEAVKDAETWLLKGALKATDKIEQVHVLPSAGMMDPVELALAIVKAPLHSSQIIVMSSQMQRAGLTGLVKKMLKQ